MKETVNERVYRLVKADVTRGLYIPGTRIDVPSLADRLATSLTPVRMTLTRLSGEGLIELHTNQGFYLPRLTEPALRDLLDWSQLLAGAALRWQSGPISDEELTDLLQHIDQRSPLAVEYLLQAIASLSPNSELHLAMDRLNDRLRCVRTVAAEAMVADHALLLEMMELVRKNELRVSRLAGYHNRQKDLVPTLVRALYSANRAK